MSASASAASIITPKLVQAAAERIRRNPGGRKEIEAGQNILRKAREIPKEEISEELQEELDNLAELVE